MVKNTISPLSTVVCTRVGMFHPLCLWHYSCAIEKCQLHGGNPCRAQTAQCLSRPLPQLNRSVCIKEFMERERIEQENINGGKMEDNERGQRKMRGGGGQ